MATGGAATLMSDTRSEASDCGTGTSGWTSGTGGGSSTTWDVRDELIEFMARIGIKDTADLYQDRFRVDRKKLEQMLTGDDEAPLPADIFFEQIMEDTETFITWPSKLKIGAKSKKDPHVRISGRQENVLSAKERILTALDSRSNRVTMKMDVSYTDHSHLIGKAGLSIKRIMEETHCHVHFPDSNRSNPMEKSNQVSIAGDIQGVELARSRLRQKTPVIFGFELPVMPKTIDVSHPYIMKIQEQYSVQVMFRTRPKLHAILVQIKGVEWEIDQVKRATMALIEYLCDNYAAQTSVQMTMEISPHHQSFVMGKNSANVKEIMRNTNAQIMFTDAMDPNIASLKKSNVVITGNIHNVYAARQLLIGSLPLIMMFDLPERFTVVPLKPEVISAIQHKFDVSINMRLKVKQNVMSCIIKGTERLATKIYQARNEILGIDELAIVADIPISYHLPMPTSAELPTPTPLKPVPVPTARNMWQFPPPASPVKSAPTPTSLGNTSEGASQPPFVGMFKQQQFVFDQVQTSNVGTSNNGSGFGSLNGSSGYQSMNHTSFAMSPELVPAANRLSGSLSSISSPDGQSARDASNLSSIALSPTTPTNQAVFDYERKRIAGFKAMQNKPTGQSYRYPNSAWSGYGISNTAPGHISSREDDSVWSTPTLEPESILNTSNTLDRTPSSILQKITSMYWPDLPTLLTSVGLEKYIGLFISHEIDLMTFQMITDKDLVELGVTAFGARRKMLLVISELNKRSKPFSPAPGAERQQRASTGSANTSLLEAENRISVAMPRPSV